VAVVYDTRRDSRAFAHRVAEQLAANDIDVLVVDAPRPTPLLSYLVRTRGCGAGVVISASHNPAGDNGIKIYGADGAQVLGARDRALMEAIVAATHRPLSPVGRGAGSIEVLASAEALASVDEPYLRYVLAQGVVADDLAPTGLSVVYTPLHGVGHTAVIPVLRARGVSVSMVEAQAPDGGRFATVESANPESPLALALARAQAEAEGADLVIGTDPDADRIGALVRQPDGSLGFIDGNRLGVILLDHVLRLHTRVPPGAPDGWVLTTVVTSPLVGTLARAHGIDVVDDLLVGFKHHAGMMAEHPERTVVFATEESHGYLRGDEVHDKDGAIAALLLAEAAALAKASGETLQDNLARVWQQHGYHREKTASIYAYGAAGREAIAHLVSTWRREAPASFGGLKVVSVQDRAQGQQTGSPTRDLPADVLIWELEAGAGVGCRLVLRPSGTEPKVKVYALVRGPGELTMHALSRQRDAIDRLTDAVLDDARLRAEAVMAPLLSR
jgi:phosphomannomutase